MNQKASPKGRGKTIRFVLAGILVLVLGYAVFDAFQSDSEAPVDATELVVDSNHDSGETQSDSIRVTVAYHRLPKESVDEALAHSPFEFDGTYVQTQRLSPEAFEISESPDEVPADEERFTLFEPNTQPVIILETAQGRVAKVGEQLVREGSMVGNGIYVFRIEPDRILLGNEAKQEDDSDRDE